MSFSRRRRLRRKEVKEFLAKAAASLGLEKLSVGKNVEVVKINSHQLFFISETPAIIATNSEIFPTLSNQDILNQFPIIVVDRGAIPHICNGADLMAPGIVRIEDDFQVNTVVAVIDETYLKTISIVKTLYTSTQMLAKKQGKVAINLHHIGDKLWDAYKHI